MLLQSLSFKYLVCSGAMSNGKTAMISFLLLLHNVARQLTDDKYENLCVSSPNNCAIRKIANQSRESSFLPRQCILISEQLLHVQPLLWSEFHQYDRFDSMRYDSLLCSEDQRSPEPQNYVISVLIILFGVFVQGNHDAFNTATSFLSDALWRNH